MKTLVIIPCYNEEQCIVNTVDKLQNDIKNFYENGMPSSDIIDYLVVNDCSKDNSKSVLISHNIRHISLPINLGIGGAVASGYKYALKNGYDIAVQIDGDGQHDTKYLYDVIKPILDGNADIVIGSRFIKREGFQSSTVRRFGINFLNFWIRLFCGQKVTDCTSGYRAVNRTYIELYSKDYPIDYPEPEAIVRANLNGANIMEMPVIMKERQGGKSSIRPIHSLYYMVKVSASIMLCRLTYKRVRNR